MTTRRLQIPTDEQIANAEKALVDLGKKEKPLSATEKIWKALGPKIIAARNAGHNWNEIAAALAQGGIAISGAALRTSAPKTGRKPIEKKTGGQ